MDEELKRLGHGRRCAGAAGAVCGEGMVAGGWDVDKSSHTEAAATSAWRKDIAESLYVLNL